MGKRWVARMRRSERVAMDESVVCDRRWRYADGMKRGSQVAKVQVLKFDKA
jgi:hypothetical protein